MRPLRLTARTLLLCGTALTCCAMLVACGRETPPEPIPAVPTQLVCPAPAKPPAELLKRPVKTDFLPDT